MDINKNQESDDESYADDAKLKEEEGKEKKEQRLELDQPKKEEEKNSTNIFLKFGVLERSTLIICMKGKREDFEEFKIPFSSTHLSNDPRVYFDFEDTISSKELELVLTEILQPEYFPRLREFVVRLYQELLPAKKKDCEISVPPFHLCCMTKTRMPNLIFDFRFYYETEIPTLLMPLQWNKWIEGLRFQNRLEHNHTVKLMLCSECEPKDDHPSPVQCKLPGLLRVEVTGITFACDFKFECRNLLSASLFTGSMDLFHAPNLNYLKLGMSLGPNENVLDIKRLLTSFEGVRRVVLGVRTHGRAWEIPYELIFQSDIQVVLSLPINQPYGPNLELSRTSYRIPQQLRSVGRIVPEDFEEAILNPTKTSVSLSTHS